MERLPLLGSGSKPTTTPFYLTLDNTTSTSTSSPPRPPPVTEAAVRPSSISEHSRNERGTDTIKAKIMSHPLYPALLRAFIDCQKVGAPPDVVGRLSALADELKSHSDDRQEESPDPELDQFMETYCDTLVRYREELTRPIQEANDFFRSMEAQLESFALDDNENGEGNGSSDEDQEGADMAGFPEISSTNHCEEDKELKNQLLNKYSGYLSSLWKKLSKKKKKGKLPRDARQKLLHWWQIHYRWPYPSEKEKAALAETTGLDAKQINNWFINQRKRHWKPTAATAYRFHPHSAASSSSAAALRMDGQYFTGGSAYPRGP